MFLDPHLQPAQAHILSKRQSALNGATSRQLRRENPGVTTGDIGATIIHQSPRSLSPGLFSCENHGFLGGSLTKHHSNPKIKRCYKMLLSSLLPMIISSEIWPCFFLGGLIFRLDGGVTGVQERFRGPPASHATCPEEKMHDLCHPYPKWGLIKTKRITSFFGQNCLL